MGAKLENETTKIHIHVYTKDLERLDSHFCRQGMRVVGRSKVIRKMLNTWLNHMERKIDAKPVKFDPTVTDIIAE